MPGCVTLPKTGKREQKIMAIPPEAARTTFDGANDLFVEDGSLGLKYVLQRLELVGLTEQDRQNLRDLAAAACRDQDVAGPAERVRTAPSAAPLAVAIADIVEHSGGSKKAAVLGAIFGAHGSLMPFGGGRDPIEGAAAGAAVASAIALVEGRTLGFGLDEFLVRE
jgi:hypothetical protein